MYWKLPKGRRPGIKDAPIREMQRLLEDYEKRRSWYSLVICTMKTITIQWILHVFVFQKFINDLSQLLFDSGDEILWCDHSTERKLFDSTFTWYYLF